MSNYMFFPTSLLFHKNCMSIFAVGEATQFLSKVHWSANQHRLSLCAKPKASAPLLFVFVDFYCGTLWVLPRCYCLSFLNKFLNWVLWRHTLGIEWVASGLWTLMWFHNRSQRERETTLRLLTCLWRFRLCVLWDDGRIVSVLNINFPINTRHFAHYMFVCPLHGKTSCLCSRFILYWNSGYLVILKLVLTSQTYTANVYYVDVLIYKTFKCNVLHFCFTCLHDRLVKNILLPLHWIRQTFSFLAIAH